VSSGRSARIETSHNNRRTVGSGVFCAVLAETITRTSCHYERVLKRQLEIQEVGVRLSPTCEDVSPEAEELPLLEDDTKQRSEDRE
jgi:hypothetical protein